jgi:hypothetical protein
MVLYDESTSMRDVLVNLNAGACIETEEKMLSQMFHALGVGGGRE